MDGRQRDSIDRNFILQSEKGKKIRVNLNEKFCTAFDSIKKYQETNNPENILIRFF